MDITGATSFRMRMAVSRMNDGEPVEFAGVRFRLANGRLEVESFSHLAPQAATPLHAQKKIAESKSVLAELEQLCPMFDELVERMPRVFLCSYGDGAGGVRLAREQAGQFEWLTVGSRKDSM